jgi:hypothetical protein
VVWRCNFKYSLAAWVISPEVTRAPPIIFSAVRCQVSPATPFNLCASFHTKVEMVAVVYLHPVEGDGWPPPDGISYYLLGVCVRRSKAGLDLDLVATKYWLAPIRLLRVPSLLKSAVERCNSKLLSFPW